MWLRNSKCELDGEVILNICFEHGNLPASNLNLYKNLLSLKLLLSHGFAVVRWCKAIVSCLECLL